MYSIFERAKSSRDNRDLKLLELAEAMLSDSRASLHDVILCQLGSFSCVDEKLLIRCDLEMTHLTKVIVKYVLNDLVSFATFS